MFGDDQLEADDLTVCGPLGRQLCSGQDEIRAALRDPRTRFGVGKLFPQYRWAEIAENDGKDEALSWVVHDDRVYDVTGMSAPFHELSSSQESHSTLLMKHVIYTEFQTRNDGISRWLSFCAGGTIFTSMEDEHDHLAEVLASIRKYQIGVVMDESKAELSPGISGLLLTQSMLRRFDNPMDGVYTAIGGNVYNLTRYIDIHPGGALAIQAVAGRDGTKEFSRHHGLDLMDKPEFAALKVGRYIEERDQGNVDEDEIVLHDLIFNISGERPSSQSCLLKLSKC